MTSFAEYKVLLENLGVELNPPASPCQIAEARSQGMPEFLCDLYSQFNGMPELKADSRNELHLGSLDRCLGYRLNLPNMKNIDHLFIIGHVLIYSFYIAVDQDKHDGVFYLSYEADKAYDEFDMFMERIYEGTF